VARAGEGGGGGDPRDDPTALKDGDLSLGYAYARTLPPTVALTNNNPGAIPGSSWGRPTPVGVYGTHREVYHNILSREEEYGGGGGGAQQHAAPPHVDFHHRSSLHGAQLHQASGYEASLKREVHRSSEDPAAAAAGLRGTNFDQRQEEEEEGSSNSGSVGKGTRGNHPSSSVVQQQQSWALAVREVDEGATQGMNVQSLQQHNPATASVHVGPSEPDNHLHLHGMNSTLSCPLIAPPSLPFSFFFSLTISLALQEVVYQASFPPIPAVLMMLFSILFFALPSPSIFSPAAILCLVTLWRFQQSTQTCFSPFLYVCVCGHVRYSLRGLLDCICFFLECRGGGYSFCFQPLLNFADM
jgi:hypothetical protein